MRVPSSRVIPGLNKSTQGQLLVQSVKEELIGLETKGNTGQGLLTGQSHPQNMHICRLCRFREEGVIRDSSLPFTPDLLCYR